jgi:hypothetical protein
LLQDGKKGKLGTARKRSSVHAVSRMILPRYLVRGMKVSRHMEWNIRNVEKAKNGTRI